MWRSIGLMMQRQQHLPRYDLAVILLPSAHRIGAVMLGHTWRSSVRALGTTRRYFAKPYAAIFVPVVVAGKGGASGRTLRGRRTKC